MINNIKSFLVLQLVILILLLSSFGVVAQQNIPIFGWDLHIPIKSQTSVTQSDAYIYEASASGLVRIDKTTLEHKFISKIDGLTDSNPHKLVYDKTTETLVIAYDNGNIDLIDENGVFNMPNILSSAKINTDKTPNRARIGKAGRALICYGFGIVEINLENQTFGFSLIADFIVHDAVYFDEQYLLSTEDGVLIADAADQINHGDISQWTNKAGTNNWPASFYSQAIVAVGDKLYLGINGALYEYGNTPILIESLSASNYDLRSLSELNEQLGVIYTHTGSGFKIDLLKVYDKSNQLVAMKDKAWAIILAHEVIAEPSGRTWMADEGNIFVYFDGLNSGAIPLTFPGPFSKNIDDIRIDNNVIYVAAGGVTDKGRNTFSKDGFYTYQNNEWTRTKDENDLVDYHRMLVAPSGEIIIGTYDDGMIRFPKEGDPIFINDENSCLDIETIAQIRTRIADMEYDRAGGIWVTNNRAANPLKYFDKEWNCTSFNPGSGEEYGELVVARNGFKWIGTIDEVVGLVVFDEGDIDDPRDDRSFRVTSSNSELENNKVLSLVEDLDGDIWVGTNSGITVFECPESIFDSGCSGRRPKVDVDGSIAFLLANEKVRTIAVDGANRKWFGTNNGIFVLSANGEELVLELNRANSPLISNIIQKIAINPETGEVYIGTVDGLMVFRTDATNGGDLHEEKSQVYAFPNPVEPNYSGPIAIKGLARDADVKITDLAGKLVFQTTANGGQAIWDGIDYEGRRVRSGVYLVFSTQDVRFEKPDALVTKILIVN